MHDSYFDLPNTTLPILNTEEYLDAFEGRTTPPPPPLLTYAICTYACFLVSYDHSVFEEVGMTCEQVFHALVDRAAGLIRRDYLVPRISTIKALVILCSLPTYSTSSYRNWILAGMAVRMVCYCLYIRHVNSDLTLNAGTRRWTSSHNENGSNIKRTDGSTKTAVVQCLCD